MSNTQRQNMLLFVLAVAAGAYLAKNYLYSDLPKSMNPPSPPLQRMKPAHIHRTPITPI